MEKLSVGRRGPHAIALPFPLQGHITPMLQLCRFLASQYGFKVTVVHNPHNLSRLRSNFPEEERGGHIRMVGMSYLDGSHNLPAKPADRVKATEDLFEPFRLFVKQRMMMEEEEGLKTVVIISDGLMSWTQTVCDEFSIARVALWTSSSACCLAYANLPRLMAEARFPITDLERSTGIEGFPLCITMADLPSFLQVDNIDDALFQFICRQIKLMRRADFVLLNTFDELEGEMIAPLREEYSSSTLAVGPLLTLSSPHQFIRSSLWEEDDRCLKWLDQWPPHTVLYVSLGSLAVVSQKQSHELALGLEESDHPFIWSCRPNMVEYSDEVNALPDGFLSRNAHRCLVVAWTPQQQVLAHSSVGGFLTHCGWNSVLESIIAGVPLLAWPNFFAEQRMNMRLVVETWRIGLELHRGSEDLVKREEIATKVKALMMINEDDPMRRSVQRLKDAASRAGYQGGSSSFNIDLFVNSILHRYKVGSVEGRNPP